MLLLRGINVGKKKVEMAKLRNLLSTLGYQHVKTILNSGNAIFETEQTKDQIFTILNSKLEDTFGFPIDIIIRTEEEIQTLISHNPFKGIHVTKNNRLYITFLSKKPSKSMSIPYESANKDFQIIEVTDSEVISVLTISEQFKTTDAMKILEKEFGKNITTRNWNTVLKLVQS